MGTQVLLKVSTCFAQPSAASSSVVGGRLLSQVTHLGGGDLGGPASVKAVMLGLLCSITGAVCCKRRERFRYSLFRWWFDAVA